MKNKSIGSLILLAILAPSCGGGGGGGSNKHPITAPHWSETYRRPTSVDLRAVRFGNAQSGIAAGKYGTFVRTDDGGVTWRYLEAVPGTPTGDVLAMAVGGITTFAVGGAPVGATPSTYTSTVAWESLDATNFAQPDSLPSVFGEAWVDVSLTVPGTNAGNVGTLRLRQTGLVDAYQGSLIGTFSSMHNAQPASPPPVPDTPWTAAYGISALGSSGIWVVCGDNAGGQIRRTTDDGADFDTVYYAAASPALRRIRLLDSTHGFAVGDSNTVLYTTNMTTWTAMTPPGGLPAGNLRALSFVNPSLGWAVGDGGRVYKFSFSSPNWTWTVQTSNTGQDLYDVWFVDSNTGYAVGNNGTVVKTTNGGALWTVISQPAVNPTPTFNAVDVSSDGVVALAGGNSGTLVRSVDGGATWTSFATGVGSRNITALAIPRAGSETVAFAGADDGSLFVNTDLQGTGTWQGPVAFPAAVRAVLFPKDDTQGVAVGASGNIRILNYSTLGGLTLATPTTVPAQAGSNFGVASDPTGNTLYVCGDNGYVVTSTDGGDHWAAVAGTPVGGGTSLRSIQAPSGATYTLFAAGADGNVYRLSAGAAPAWTATNTTAFGTPISLAFTDDLTGWALTKDPTNGGVFFTSTGGTFWNRLALHVPVDDTTHVLNAIRMLPSTEGFIVGANGVLIQTTTGGF